MKDMFELRRKEDELWEEDDGRDDPIIAKQIDAIGFLKGELDPITEENQEVPTTDEGLDKLIAQLKIEREQIAEYSFFGDSNWKIIDAQIAICEWAKS